jgi:hypothetical protein
LKKIAAIVLLILLVFNWCGYRFLFNWAQEKADTQLEAKLDKNEYREDDLIEISVPLNLPYQTDWADFERVDGEIEIDGIHYKYVKRKVQQGQLVLKCIPNHSKQQMLNARDTFFQLVNDLQQDQPEKKSSSQKSITKLNISDYEEQVTQQFNHKAISLVTKFQGSTHVYFSSTNFHNTPEQPPEQVRL